MLIVFQYLSFSYSDYLCMQPICFSMIYYYRCQFIILCTVQMPHQLLLNKYTNDMTKENKRKLTKNVVVLLITFSHSSPFAVVGTTNVPML